MVTRRMAALAVAAVAAIVVACGEYAHVNPYDIDTDVRIEITGPDTAWSTYQVLHYDVTVTPAIHAGRGVDWDADDYRIVAPLDRGTLQTRAVGETFVVARVGRHEARRRIVVRQRGARVFFGCPSVPCASVNLNASGSESALNVAQYDAFGTPLAAGQLRVPVSYSSKDAAIVEIVPGSGSPTGVTIRAVARGSAYVHAQVGDWADSVLVTVGAH